MNSHSPPFSSPPPHDQAHSAPAASAASPVTPQSRRVPPAHEPHERHQPHIRRQRRRRVARHLFLRRYGWLGVFGITVGSLAIFIGSLWVTAFLLNSASHYPIASGGDDLAPIVLQTCQESMPRVNCGCFWEKSKATFTEANTANILQALIEREQWGPAITRARLVRVAGEDAARDIGRALYDCVQM